MLRSLRSSRVFVLLRASANDLKGFALPQRTTTGAPMMPVIEYSAT
ncbi:hypothetical protein [Silanimonas sp.]|nr:hypothetical protein [Silanimonas sp.]MBS3896527.1 hypothetical protein [Silanimonas sp.]